MPASTRKQDEKTGVAASALRLERDVYRVIYDIDESRKLVRVRAVRRVLLIAARFRREGDCYRLRESDRDSIADPHTL